MQFTCPVCSRETSVPESYRGKNWRCPSCQVRLRPELDGSVVLLDAPPDRAEPASGSVVTVTDKSEATGTTAPWSKALLFLAGMALGAILAYLWLR
ncbi:MAG: hypothetical protein ACYTFT_12655 [Planctomycetota bacterium]|jgi:hypothetical protein